MKTSRAMAFIAIFAGYLLINSLLSGFFATARYVPYYITQLKWEFLAGIFLSVMIAALVAANSITILDKLKERRKKGAGALTCVGGFAGLATGVCSACSFGIIAVALSAVGISFAALPFKGLEVQALTALVLLSSFFWLRK